MKHIIKMYHTNKINQVSNQKNLHSSRFSSKDLHTDHYTSTEQKIYRYIQSYQKAPWIKLSNDSIAKAVGCSIITVIRTTNKLHRNNLITKYQENKYSSNNYSLRTIVDHENKRIFQSEYDIPTLKSKSLFLEESLFSNRVLVLVQRTRGDTYPQIFNKKRGKKRERVMNAIQKQLILKSKHDPKVKEILALPHIREEIITPTIQSIAELFALNEQEQFKLVAFREDVLQHTLAESQLAVDKYTSIGYTIRDRIQWVVHVAKTYSNDNNIKIDWAWYYELCEILGMDKHVVGRSLSFGTKQAPKRSYNGKNGTPEQKTQPNPAAQRYNNPIELAPDERLRRWKIELEARQERITMYGESVREKRLIAKLKQQIADFEGQEEIPTSAKLSPWEQNQRLLPLEARVEKWTSEVEKLEEQFAKFPDNDPYGLKGLLARTIDNAKEELVKATKLLEESNEKQKVLYQHNPYRMATVSA